MTQQFCVASKRERSLKQRAAFIDGDQCFLVCLYTRMRSIFRSTPFNAAFISIRRENESDNKVTSLEQRPYPVLCARTECLRHHSPFSQMDVVDDTDVGCHFRHSAHSLSIAGGRCKKQRQHEVDDAAFGSKRPKSIDAFMSYKDVFVLFDQLVAPFFSDE